MIHFEDILEKVEAYNPNSDQDLLRRAYVFSAREHRGQVRRSGEPYLVHPLNVASILADLKADDVSIVVIWKDFQSRRTLAVVPAAAPIAAAAKPAPAGPTGPVVPSAAPRPSGKKKQRRR